MSLYPPMPVPSAPPARAYICGEYEGKKMVHLDAFNKKVVIYPSPKGASQLIALPYEGAMSLRKVQSVVAALFAGGIGTVLAISLCVSVLPLGFSLIAGLATACVITGIALIIIWTCNKTDPDAQMERRKKLLDQNSITASPHTTPLEKREMFRNKPHLDLASLMKDEQTLNSLGLLTEAEVTLIHQLFSTLVRETNALEACRRAIVETQEAQYQTVRAAAREKYESNGFVIAGHVLDLGLVAARLDRRGRRVVQTAALAGVRLATFFGEERARQKRYETVARAREGCDQGIARALQEIHYAERASILRRDTEKALQTFKEAFVPAAHERAVDSTLSWEESGLVIFALSFDGERR